MEIPGFIRRLFRGGAAAAAEIADDSIPGLAARMEQCIDSSQGALAARRRAAALAAQFARLDVEGRDRFLEALAALGSGDTPTDAAGRIYDAVETAEWWGGRDSASALADAFLPPRRRLLHLLAAQRNGSAILDALRRFAEERNRDDIAADIASVRDPDAALDE